VSWEKDAEIEVAFMAGRYHHPSRAAGFPGPLPVLMRDVALEGS
jgi:hypothetical protein